jgi:hypothetical protein
MSAQYYLVCERTYIFIGPTDTVLCLTWRCVGMGIGTSIG